MRPGISELAAEGQAFAADAEVVGDLERLLFVEVRGAVEGEEGAVAKPGKPEELAAQKSAPAPELLRSHILDGEVDDGRQMLDDHLANHLAALAAGRAQRQPDIIAG